MKPWRKWALLTSLLWVLRALVSKLVSCNNKNSSPSLITHLYRSQKRYSCWCQECYSLWQDACHYLWSFGTGMSISLYGMDDDDDGADTSQCFAYACVRLVLLATRWSGPTPCSSLSTPPCRIESICARPCPWRWLEWRDIEAIQGGRRHWDALEQAVGSLWNLSCQQYPFHLHWSPWSFWVSWIHAKKKHPFLTWHLFY